MRVLGPSDVQLVRRIDRSERVEVEYTVAGGEIVERPVTMIDVPTWQTEGDGDHTVESHMQHVRDDLARGGVLLGAFVDGDVVGLAVVVPSLEGHLAQLSWLHVSRPHRRVGAATALWGAATEIARGAGAAAMYVSASPTGSAVGFYLSRACRLAVPVDPTLYALEPDDIHLIAELG